MLMRFIKTAALAIPVLAVIGCASARPATYGLDPGAASLVRQTCTEIMGLRVGLAEFDACGDSLAQSVRVVQDAYLIARAHKQCELEGFAQGTAELAKCVVVTKRAQGRPVSEDLPSPPVAEARPVNSYFSKSRSQQDESMELSCAHLGLHPATGGFRQCVVSLKEAIFVAQNPNPL
jgi:hypothetical protein